MLLRVAQEGLLVPALHVQTGAVRGFDHWIERDLVLARFAEGTSGGVDDFHRDHRVAFDARNSVSNRRFRHEAVYDVHCEERSHELRSHNSRPL